jgi:hypothetical protein
MLIDLNEDTLQWLTREKVVVQFRIVCSALNNETKIQKIWIQKNDAITFFVLLMLKISRIKKIGPT